MFKDWANTSAYQKNLFKLKKDAKKLKGKMIYGKPIVEAQYVFGYYDVLVMKGNLLEVHCITIEYARELMREYNSRGKIE